MSPKYSFILEKKEFFFDNEKELAFFFEIINKNKKEDVANTISWAIIMQLDEQLLDIIQTYKGLLSCLRRLSAENSALLLFKVGDNLVRIIESSSNLAIILSRIPHSENQKKILKQINDSKGFNRIVLNAGDLGNIVEWIYDDVEDYFLDILGDEFIANVFLSTYEIKMILHFLSDKNKDRIMDIIGLNKAKNKIKTSANLLVMLRGMTLDKSREFLDLFSKDELLNLFTNNADFHDFLLKLPQSKENIFITKLKG